MKTYLCAAVCAATLAGPATPALATDRIVFDSDREGLDLDVWSMRPDGRGLVNLTPDGSNAPGAPGETEYFDAQASWRPDGRKIVFVSDRSTPTNTEGDNEVFVMNADGSNQTQITFNALSERFPAWSPDGRKIVVQRDMDPNRTDDLLVHDIFTMTAEGRHERNVTRTPSLDEFEPTWSPNGRLIAFTSVRGGDDADIYTMNPLGGDVRQLTNDPGDDAFPDWSPDGRLIAFMGASIDAPDVFTMRADGSRRTQLTFNPAPEGLPVWSPDGRHLAFTSARDGGFDIFTMRADGRHQVNLTHDEAFDIAPDW
jgi:Tol biopolymer transport system component